jgi:hypothetical protein
MHELGRPMCQGRPGRRRFQVFLATLPVMMSLSAYSHSVAHPIIASLSTTTSAALEHVLVRIRPEPKSLAGYSPPRG